MEHQDIRTRIDHAAREEIDVQVKEFLARGGKIERVGRGESAFTYTYRQGKDNGHICIYSTKTRKRVTMKGNSIKACERRKELKQ